MGAWNVECFVNSADVQLIHAALVVLFKRDGFHSCEKPTQSECLERGQKRLYRKFSSEPLWGVSVFPCKKTGWSYLHCDPANLLCERPRKSKSARLALLAAELKVVTFQINVEDSTAMTLLECSADGGYSVGGSTYDADANGLEPPYPFFQETIYDYDIRFHCKELMQFNSFLNVGSHEAASEKIGSTLSGVSAKDYVDFSHHNGPFIKYEKIFVRSNARGEYWDLKPVVRPQTIAGAQDFFFKG